MIYFNNAATSFPKPGEVIERVNRVLRETPAEQSRGAGAAGSASPDSCRKTAASFFNLKDSRQIIFTSGATESLNTLIFGMTEPGCRVVTTVTEHNSVLRPLFQLEDRGDIDLCLVGCDRQGYIDLDSLANELKIATDLVVINHASNVTGAIQDIEKIIDICNRSKTPIILDASQSAGHIPVSDFGYNKIAVAFTGHKGLFGIQGSGGFYISPGIKCRPFKLGGTGSRSESRQQPSEFPVYFEAGTRGLPGICSMDAGMKWITDQNLSKIESSEARLRNLLIDGISGHKKVKLFAADRMSKSTGLLSFAIDGFSPDDISYVLERSFGIITRPGLHCAPLMHKAIGTYPEGTVRISFSVFNSKDEVLQLINAVESIAETVAAV